MHLDKYYIHTIFRYIVKITYLNLLDLSNQNKVTNFRWIQMEPANTQLKSI
jgi:hypothetical protein